MPSQTFNCNVCGKPFTVYWCKSFEKTRPGGPKRCPEHKYSTITGSCLSNFADLSKEACYWIGLLATDGCLVDRRYSKQITLGLSSKDVDHVDLFKQFTGSTNKVSVNVNAAMLSFTDNQLFDFLTELGLTPRKSLSLKISSDILLSSLDFWRGVVDGDGCIGYACTRHYPAISLCSSSHLFIEQWKNLCDSVVPSRSILLNKRTKNPHYIYRIVGRNAVKLIKLLYYSENKIALSRKATIAKEILCLG